MWSWPPQCSIKDLASKGKEGMEILLEATHLVRYVVGGDGSREERADGIGHDIPPLLKVI